MALELGDNLVEEGVLLVSLGFGLTVNFSLVLEVRDSLIEGVSGLLEDNVDLGLLGDGSLDLLGGAVSVKGLSLVFGNESIDFSSA